MNRMDNFFIERNDKGDELKKLRSKNRRSKAFITLIALQTGALVLSYFLGRSHK